MGRPRLWLHAHRLRDGSQLGVGCVDGEVDVNPIVTEEGAEVACMNFDFVTDRLAVGTTPNTANDVATLLAAKITHLINCQIEHDDALLLAGSGIIYLWDGTEDWNPLQRTYKPSEWFQKGVEIGLPALCRPQTKLYVHCHAGTNRSA